MSAPAFTKGPWSVVPYGDDYHPDPVIHSDAQNRVCFMATPGENRAVDETTIEANARLIAAAPELYGAVEAFLIQIRDRWSDADLVHSCWGKVVADGDAALAKARGETL